MPVGFMAAIVQHESDGNFNSAGDASLGEIGYFQVAQDTGSKFGVDPNVRRDPEGNVFLAGLEYNVNAARITLNYPQIQSGTADQWKFARLIFAIGYGGTTGLLNKAISAGAIGNAAPYNDFVNWANAGGASGTQLNRINDVQVQWAIGQSVVGDGPGVPSQIPEYVAYSLPAGIELASFDFMNLLLIAAGVAAVILLGELLD